MKATQSTGFWGVMGFCALCLTGTGVAPTFGEDLNALLPTAAQSKEWTPKGAPKRLTGEQIYDYMDGAGEIPLACGYQTLAVAEYFGKSGAVLTIERYDMGSSANAFGLYSMKRLPTGRVVTTLGSHAAPVQAQAGFNELLCHKGRYTVLLFGDASWWSPVRMSTMSKDGPSPHHANAMETAGSVIVPEFGHMKQLYIVDALRFGETTRGPQYYQKSLIFGTDPVATDMIALEVFLKSCKT